MADAFRLLIVLTGICWLGAGQAIADNNDETYGLLSGAYLLVGQMPDSTVTFSGQVRITKKKGRLAIVRTIGGSSTTGVGTLENALQGETKVLRVRFAQNAKPHEATYLIDHDLDNYPRLTGYLYRQDGSTRQAGLETLFADFGQLGRK